MPATKTIGTSTISFNNIRNWQDPDWTTVRSAIEVESLSGTKDLVNAVQNAVKALRLADSLEIVVKNRHAAETLKKTLMQSPLKNARRIKIYQLDRYKL